MLKRHGTTKEEKVAVKIGALLLDLTLDLEAVAFYLGRATSYVVFNRILEVLESAQHQKDGIEKDRLEINRDWKQG
jgi:hypothetical protein